MWYVATLVEKGTPGLDISDGKAKKCSEKDNDCDIQVGKDLRI